MFAWAIAQLSLWQLLLLPDGSHFAFALLVQTPAVFEPAFASTVALHSWISQWSIGLAIHIQVQAAFHGVAAWAKVAWKCHPNPHLLTEVCPKQLELLQRKPWRQPGKQCLRSCFRQYLVHKSWGAGCRHHLWSSFAISPVLEAGLQSSCIYPNLRSK